MESEFQDIEVVIRIKLKLGYRNYCNYCDCYYQYKFVTLLSLLLLVEGGMRVTETCPGKVGYQQLRLHYPSAPLSLQTLNEKLVSARVPRKLCKKRTYFAAELRCRRPPSPKG